MCNDSRAWGFNAQVNLWATFWKTQFSQDEIKYCKKVFNVGHVASSYIRLFFNIIYPVPNGYRASLWEAVEDNSQPRVKQEYRLDLSEAQK